MQPGIARAAEKMRQDGASERALRVFTNYANWIEQGVTGLIPEAEIEPITDVFQPNGETSTAEDNAALEQTVVVKLNGGLGTSMGMEQAKSLLPVRDGLTFLDIICGQIRHVRESRGVRLPLIFLNSFRTQADTLAALPADILVPDLPIDMVQGREPKLLVDSLEPVSWPAAPELEWCPPGHGDIYTAMLDSDLVELLLAQGYKYLMSSNSDNLGATPSAELAGWFARSGADYAPEVCLRTPADRKGGHLAIRKADGRTILRDTAQTPPADMDYFTDETVHPYFHTNNLWFNLESLHELLKRTDGLLELPLIKNQKNVDPTDPDSPQVYQIECAMGAVVEKFANVQPVLVGRERFLPVKTTSDLLLLRSDFYQMQPDFRITTERDDVPRVQLDPKYYKTIAQFEQRFQQIPSLREITSLQVTGDMYFNEPMQLSGDVVLQG
ncbi:MAG: UTP--glucose-1-phosphate uridylyltransferase [Trueperella sp.]|nr:UTP--glucose-1-phosphate uridylyltransferase [Trueperella sp.]